MNKAAQAMKETTMKKRMPLMRLPQCVLDLPEYKINRIRDARDKLLKEHAAEAAEGRMKIKTRIPEGMEDGPLAIELIAVIDGTERTFADVSLQG